MSPPRPQVVLCVGEPLIALVPHGASSLETADHLEVMAGGAELNVALHLVRRGFQVRFGGLVGDDPWGRRLRNLLVQEGVDTSALSLDPLLPTGAYVKDVSDGRTVMHYYRQGSAASSLARLADEAYSGIHHLHLSGITPALSPSCAAYAEAALSSPRDYSISFDVNYRSALWPATVASEVLRACAVQAETVFVGLDEARALWGCADASAVRALFPAVAELIVKDGPREATAFTPSGTATAPSHGVEVVDAVGAGDAFAAGYLAARWRGEPPVTCLAAGHQLAAQVIVSYGDHGQPAPQDSALKGDRRG